MIDEQVAADAGAGMDVDTGEEPRDMVHDPGQQEHLAAIEPVGQTVQANRVQPRIGDISPTGCAAPDRGRGWNWR